MPNTYPTALGVSRVLLQIWRVLNIAIAVADVGMLIASFIFEPAVREYYSRRPTLEPDVIIPTMRVWMVLGLPLFAAIHVLISRLLEMVETVRAGEPFVPENAGRMKTIAWCLLGVQIFDLVCGVMAGIVSRAGSQLDWSPSLSGWVAVVLLFVLARVFEEGARIRADLEAMV